MQRNLLILQNYNEINYAKLSVNKLIARNLVVKQWQITFKALLDDILFVYFDILIFHLHIYLINWYNDHIWIYLKYNKSVLYW